ncbi:MAG: sensor histidine kinase [Actinomycetales bacterium]|nr:MAG: sensor histidine kinase [Actinomycetales bacterium]
MSIERVAPDRSAWGRVLGAGIWLVFLGNPLGALLDRSGDWQEWLGLASLGAFVVVYLVGLSLTRWVHVNGRHGTAVLLTVVMLVLFIGVIPGAGDQALTCIVFVAAIAVSTFRAWSGLVVAALLFAGVFVAGRVVDGWAAHGNDFAVLLATGAVWSFRIGFQRQAQLARAEKELSDLAIEEERSRIARDLHDILGHSLTVIAVKSELGGKLVDADPVRARSELEDIQRLARDALADVRSTTSGLRSLSLPREIAAARSALESAGIEPHLPTVADAVPSAVRELYAWTLREAVTNVIRHSSATRCDVSMSESVLSILDDGVGPGRTAGDGNGLEGLRQRVRAAGGTVTSGPGPDGRGFELRLAVRS